MSLLNDALRAAEQRQSRPAAPGVYVGEQPSSRNGRPVLVAVVVILALMVAGIGGYWILMGDASQEPVVVGSEPSADKPVHREATATNEDIDPDEPVDSSQPVPQEQIAATEPEPLRQPIPKPEPESEPVAVQQDAATQEPPPEPAESSQPAAMEPEPAEESPAPAARTVAETESVIGEEAEPEKASTAGVKQVPETPAATDRSTARELERLVAQGSITDAERRLAALTREQTAPRSRYVVARALLMERKQDQALQWLPESVVGQHPKLRLLRARALHASGDLRGAVNTLNSNVPPVQGHAEYRVTLATLLQRHGENSEAARHWAELIAWDDSQGPWWVGLAISLEAQGEQAGAVRAYRQAAELPGLPRSLADYVQQRLQALRAG